jgi:hypothetical protein
MLEIKQNKQTNKNNNKNDCNRNGTTFDGFISRLHTAEERISEL